MIFLHGQAMIVVVNISSAMPFAIFPITFAVAGATNVTFDVLATKLQETTTYYAGTTLNATYNITWKWDFSASAGLDDEVTKKDTLLGDIAAAGGATANVTIDKVALTKGTDYSLTEAVTFTFNAVQID